jgi:hypothetical protein
LIAIVSDEPFCKPHPNFVPVMPSTSRSTLGKEVSPSTSTERFVPFMFEQEGHVPLHLGSGRSALQPRPNATVRWRGIAGLHGFVVDWNFLPRTQA